MARMPLVYIRSDVSAAAETHSQNYTRMYSFDVDAPYISKVPPTSDKYSSFRRYPVPKSGRLLMEKQYPHRAVGRKAGIFRRRSVNRLQIAVTINRKGVYVMLSI